MCFHLTNVLSSVGTGTLEQNKTRKVWVKYKLNAFGNFVTAASNKAEQMGFNLINSPLFTMHLLL